MSDFLIRRDNLRDTFWHAGEAGPLLPGHARLAVDAFALTANNVTYAAFGEAMKYWNFFPSAMPAYGRVPVWGFATVADPGDTQLTRGRRLYGYLPVSPSFDVCPQHFSPGGFIDAAGHRQEMAQIYNTYLYTDSDPSYERDHEPQQMLLRPLFTTGWMIDDCLMETGSPIPETVIISSASSKTALALAHCLRQREGVETVALTSPGNMAFVEGTGLYARTLPYEDVDRLRTRGLTAYVDFLGRASLTAGVHHALHDRLTRSLVIGVTDWEAPRAPFTGPGPAPEFFFVPSYAAQRAGQIGARELNNRTSRALKGFYGDSARYLTPVEAVGPQAIETGWQQAVNGTIPASTGLIFRFRD